MKIQCGLVWDKHSGDLIGYVDLGDMEVNYATLENTEEISSHVLPFLIRGIINPFKFSLFSKNKCYRSAVIFIVL